MLASLKALGIFSTPFFVSIACYAQQPITVDWSSNPRTLVSYPTEVNGQTPVVITIFGVNDYLYTYTQTIQGTPRTTPSDASLIFNGPGAVGGCAVAGADAALAAATNAITKDHRLNPLIDESGKPTSKPVSVGLIDTKAAYTSLITPNLVILDALIPAFANGDCVSQFTVYKAIEKKLNHLRSADNSSHQATDRAILSPDTDYVLTIQEYSDGVPTDTGNKQFTFKPQSNVLVLSAGVGLTTLQSRSYTSTTVPDTTVSSTATKNILVVGDGGSPRPLAIGLLNYHLFGFGNGYLRNASLAISSGPVLQGSGKSDLQPLGFFGGISLSLFHRLFLTPGFHIGQFADTPAGFVPNQTVPAGFGALTPVKRWTARFGFGITYRTNNLGTSSVKTADTTATTAPATTKKAVPAAPAAPVGGTTPPATP